jgi:hypothetical protein
MASWVGMDRKSSTTNLTIMPTAAGGLLPSTCSVTTCQLELYQERMDNGGSAHVLYEVRAE